MPEDGYQESLTPQQFFTEMTRGTPTERGTIMTKQIPVSAFSILPRILFLCLRCGAAIQFSQGGLSHSSTLDSCPGCNATYKAEWKQPLEESTIVLVEEEEGEATS